MLKKFLEMLAVKKKKKTTKTKQTKKKHIQTSFFRNIRMRNIVRDCCAKRRCIKDVKRAK